MKKIIILSSFCIILIISFIGYRSFLIYKNLLNLKSSVYKVASFYPKITYSKAWNDSEITSDKENAVFRELDESLGEASSLVNKQDQERLEVLVRLYIQKYLKLAYGQKILHAKGNELVGAVKLTSQEHTEIYGTDEKTQAYDTLLDVKQRVDNYRLLQESLPEMIKSFEDATYAVINQIDTISIFQQRIPFLDN